MTPTDGVLLLCSRARNRDIGIRPASLFEDERSERDGTARDWTAPAPDATWRRFTENETTPYPIRRAMASILVIWERWAAGIGLRALFKQRNLLILRSAKMAKSREVAGARYTPGTRVILT